MGVSAIPLAWYSNPDCKAGWQTRVVSQDAFEMNGSNPRPAAERHLELSRHPTAAGEARRFVDALLRGRGAGQGARESAMLVSSELVTNALQHGRGKIELRVRLLGKFLRIEVVDQGVDNAPTVRQERADETGGWGLRIVDQLAAQWGVFEGTTHVWADLELS
jgi:anti-sigma regulatory factor (Ser/Thr protein kinase)